MLLIIPRFLRATLLALLCAAAVPALAIDYERAFDDPAMQAAAEHAPAGGDEGADIPQMHGGKQAQSAGWQPALHE